MSRFEAVTYLEWAKTMHAAPGISLAWSYAPQRSLAQLVTRFGIALDDLRLEAHEPAEYNALRDLVSARLGLPPEQVLPVASCTLANFIALAAVLGDRPSSRREVLIESPTYTPIIQQVIAAGGTPRSIPTWQAGRVEPERLVAAMNPKTAAVVISNLNNPTGRLTSPEAIVQLCDAAANHDAYVIVDEVYRDFVPEPQIAVAASLGPNAISTESLSKVHGLTALKVGWILGPPPILARAQQVYDSLGVNIPYLCQDLAVRALTHWDTFIAEARTLAAARRAQVDAFMVGRDDLTWYPPDAGLIGLIRPHRGDGDALAERLYAEQQAIIVPGRFFGLPEYNRLGFGGADLTEGLARLGHTLDAWR